MRTNLLRLLVTAIAAIGVLVYANVAFAQDEGEIPMTQEECEAAGYTWLPEDLWGFGDPAQCGGPEWEAVLESVNATPAAERTPSEPAPVEQSPADLPATEPAPAQQRAPQYTG